MKSGLQKIKTDENGVRVCTGVRPYTRCAPLHGVRPYMTFISTQWLSSNAYILLYYYWHNKPSHTWWSWQWHGVLTEKLTKSQKVLQLKWVELVPIKYDETMSRVHQKVLFQYIYSKFPGGSMPLDPPSWAWFRHAGIPPKISLWTRTWLIGQRKQRSGRTKRGVRKWMFVHCTIKDTLDGGI